MEKRRLKKKNYLANVAVFGQRFIEVRCIYQSLWSGVGFFFLFFFLETARITTAATAKGKEKKRKKQNCIADVAVFGQRFTEVRCINTLWSFFFPFFFFFFFFSFFLSFFLKK